MLNCTSFIKSFNPKIVSVDDGENFSKCDYKGDFSIILLFVYKLLVILLILFLTFAERNNKDISLDIKLVISTMYVDILSCILIYIFHSIDINNYEVNFLLQAGVMAIVSISNYIFLYSCRILIKLFIKEDESKLEKIGNSSCYRVVATKSVTSRQSRSQASKSQDSSTIVSTN